VALGISAPSRLTLLAALRTRRTPFFVNASSLALIIRGSPDRYDSTVNQCAQTAQHGIARAGAAGNELIDGDGSLIGTTRTDIPNDIDVFGRLGHQIAMHVSPHAPSSARVQ
jgi:hypothetical protein